MIKPEYGKVYGSEIVPYETKLSAEAAINTKEDVKKPISLSASAFIVSTENKEFETNAKIKVAFCFIYLADDGFKKEDVYAEATVDIPFSNAILKVTAEDARALSSPNGYVAKCAVKVNAECLKKTEVNALTGGENLKIKESVIEFDSPSGITHDTFSVSDEFELDYGVKEVLCYGATASLKEVKSDVSSIIFDGDIVLSLKTLPFSDNNDILKERRTIPFRFELDNPGSLPDMKAKGDCEPVRVSFKVFTDEAKGKSTVNAEINLAFCGESIETSTVNIVEDAYSIDGDVEISKTEMPVTVFSSQEYLTEKISGKADGDVAEGAKIIACFGGKISVMGINKTDGGFSVNGIVHSDVALKNADNGTGVVGAEMPFSIDVACGGELSGIKLNIVDSSATIKDGAIYMDYTVKIVYKSFIVKKVVVIDLINETAVREKHGCALSVYIPEKNDGLWEIAKQLRVDEEDILRCNEGIEFPLKGDERIVIYRQKT